MFWVGLDRNGCIETLKLSVSQKWIDKLNRSFACWCILKKSKVIPVIFGRHGCGHLVHEILKSAEWVYGMGWFFACWLWCHNFWSDQHCTLYLWILSASVLQLYLLDLQRQLERSCEIGSVHPSLPDICQDVFLEFDLEISLNFATVLESLMKLCMTTGFFRKTSLAPKYEEMGQKQIFFILKK